MQAGVKHPSLRHIYLSMGCGACAGHFAALEQPELLMADMRAFFATHH